MYRSFLSLMLTVLLPGCFAPRDSLAPIITIYEPANGAVQANNQTTVKGYAMDDDGIVSLLVNDTEMLEQDFYSSEKNKRLIQFAFRPTQQGEGNFSATIIAQDNDRRTHSSVLVTTDDAHILNGANLYYEKCSVCHGDTGLGIEEARATFPEDHRRCTQCHKSGNPKTVDWSNIRDNSMFDIGDPTPLRGEGALQGFARLEPLQAYIAATMPRYAPNSLEANEYRDIAEFLLYINR